MSPPPSPDQGIAVVTVDFPPVNALPVQGWYDLAAAVRAAGRDPDVRCVVLTAEGRGFNAGVDIKEMQRARAATARCIGANRGCAEAFAAVYECEVPVVAAVHGFCLGGGIGLVGNADAIVASRRRHLRPARAGPGRARRGHPSGPAGPAASDARALLHLAHRHRRRTAPRTARSGGSSRAPNCMAAARELAPEIAAKDGALIRLAKAAINGIDPVDVRRSYRFEQGFTFEANLSGVADRVRDTFGSAGIGHRRKEASRDATRR